MISMQSPQEEMAHLLSTAYGRHATVDCIPQKLEPANADDAYLVQHAFLQQRQAQIGGWKVGAKSDKGQIQGAPLPAERIYPITSTVDRGAYPVLGMELEIMFCFDVDFHPGTTAISELEVMRRVSAMAASVEIVSSRIAGWPEVPKLSQLADLQNHGALISGEFIAYDAAFPFLNPTAHLTLNGKDVFKGVASNPAGDPRRLLGWLVNHCVARGIGITAGTVVTTGSYTGIHFPDEPGMVIGQIAGLPPIHFELI